LKHRIKFKLNTDLIRPALYAHVITMFCSKHCPNNIHSG